MLGIGVETSAALAAALRTRSIPRSRSEDRLRRMKRKIIFMADSHVVEVTVSAFTAGTTLDIVEISWLALLALRVRGIRRLTRRAL